MKEGEGEMIWGDGRERYKGQWSNDSPNGYGVYIWQSPPSLNHAQVHIIICTVSLMNQPYFGERNTFSAFPLPTNLNAHAHTGNIQSGSRGQCTYITYILNGDMCIVS